MSYDYGFRQQDPQLCMWHGIDKLAERNYSISPYVYCNNNPINQIDILGLSTAYVSMRNYGFNINAMYGGGDGGDGGGGKTMGGGGGGSSSYVPYSDCYYDIEGFAHWTSSWEILDGSGNTIGRTGVYADVSNRNYKRSVSNYLKTLVCLGITGKIDLFVIGNNHLGYFYEGNGGIAYYGLERGGMTHAFIAFPSGNSIVVYEAEHPTQGDGRVLTTEETMALWRDDGAKSMIYRYDFNILDEEKDFWKFGGERNDDGERMELSPVFIPDIDAAQAWCDRQLSNMVWKYNFLSNNCKHFTIQAFEHGGAYIPWSGPKPSMWPFTFNGSYIKRP